MIDIDLHTALALYCFSLGAFIFFFSISKFKKIDILNREVLLGRAERIVFCPYCGFIVYRSGRQIFARCPDCHSFIEEK
jgi:ribosomal protein S27E